MILRKFVVTFLAVGIGGIAAYAQTTTTSTTTHTFTFPPTGLGSTEQAQVNVVNVATNSSSGTAASCAGTISFVNASNTAIGAATSFTVTSGEIASADLPFSKAGISGSRGEIRAVVSWTQISSVPCSLQFSLETFDLSSGVTHLYLTGSAPNGGGGPGPGGPH